MKAMLVVAFMVLLVSFYQNSNTSNESFNESLRANAAKSFLVYTEAFDSYYSSNSTGNGDVTGKVREGANKQVISSQADSLIKISRIWADFFPANNRISLFRLFFPPFLALFPVFTEISPTDVSFGPPETGWPG